LAGHVEREFKLRIPNEAALAELRARLGAPHAPPVLQVNHFFDTEGGALRRARIALRLRSESTPEGTAFTLALKGPSLDERSTLAARPEEELVLTEPVARGILSGARSPLDVLLAGLLGEVALVRRACELAGNEPLLRIGSFENERTRVGPLAFPPGSAGPALAFELDETRFPDGSVEHELEVELAAGARPAEVERALAELLTSLGIRMEAAQSKAARFFRSLGLRVFPLRPRSRGGRGVSRRRSEGD
jgi:uncharacterized protein YjbK